MRRRRCAYCDYRWSTLEIEKKDDDADQSPTLDHSVQVAESMAAIAAQLSLLTQAVRRLEAEVYQKLPEYDPNLVHASKAKVQQR